MDAYLHVPIHPASRKYLPFVFEHKVSVQGLTVRNFPKSVDFHAINECHSGTLMSTCHTSLPIPRRLANKRSDSQSTYLSYKIHSSNGTKSGSHTKSKEVRFDTNTTIHIYRYGISNSAGNSQSTSYQNNSLSKSSFSTNFPFSFGQTQCSSRFNYSRQIAFTTSANVPIIGLETSHSSIRSSSYDQQYDQIPFEMVDEHQSFCSRSTHSPSRPQNIPLYGCQSLRLGSSSGTSESILSWSLVGRPIPTPYQHVGNNGHSFGIDKSLQIYSPFLCHDFCRQHNSGLLYQPARRNTFSQLMCGGMENLPIRCLKHHIVIRIQHIPGKFNVLSDRLSRIDKIIKTVWALDQSIANSIFQMFNYPNLDLFATHLITNFHFMYPQFWTIKPL